MICKLAFISRNVQKPSQNKYHWPFAVNCCRSPGNAFRAPFARSSEHMAIWQHWRLITYTPALSCRVTLHVMPSVRLDNAFTDSVDNINKSEKISQRIRWKTVKIVVIRVNRINPSYPVEGPTRAHRIGAADDQETPEKRDLNVARATDPSVQHIRLGLGGAEVLVVQAQFLAGIGQGSRRTRECFNALCMLLTPYFC